MIDEEIFTERKNTSTSDDVIVPGGRCTLGDIGIRAAVR
jgi:hypothetical protein